MTLTPADNLKAFVSTRPPLVVFVTCLGMFALVLMSLAYYVKVSDVKNPDISEDWNAFLENFASLEFCILNNNSESYTTSAPAYTTKGAETSPSKVSPTTTTEGTSALPLDDDGTRNYSIAMYLTIQPTKEFISIPHNLTYLTGAIQGSDLGLKGIAGDEMINVTMTLPIEWNSTICGKLHCEPVHLYTCVYFQAAQNVFPTSGSPDVCQSVNDTGIEYHTKLAAQHPKVNLFLPYYCKAKPKIRVEYHLDPKLTVYLSIHDRSVINLHLLHTSYFLFVMVVTILLYAVIRGKPLAARVAHHDQQMLMQNEA